MKSNLCDYNVAHILVKDNITITGNIAAQVLCKYFAPFIKCMTKIDGTTIDNAEDFVMLMYNLIKYSSNYFNTTGSLWFYSKNEATNFDADIADTNNFKSFKCETKLIGSTTATNGILENTTIAVSLEYLSNFWRSLEIPLINCKIELKLKLTKLPVLAAVGNDNNLILMMLILIIIFLLSKTQKYMFLWSLYQQKTTKNYQNFLAKNLKDQFIGMNIK